MNRAKFFENLRGSLFKNGLKQEQVYGIDNLLDVWETTYFADPAEWLAYNLGTAYHETAFTMQPITERGPRSYFDKYEPGTKIGKVLGNTEPGDGYRFRGQGHVQNTGRANARKATERLNDTIYALDADLVAHPEQRGDPRISAHSLFMGNKEGWWTGKKLGDYLPGDWINARRVVNGITKANAHVAPEIAGYGKAFLAALKAGGDIFVPPVLLTVEQRLSALEIRVTKLETPNG